MRLPTAAFLSCALVSTALADTPKQKQQPSPFEARRAPKPATAPVKPQTSYTGLGAESVSAGDVAKFAARPLDPKVRW